MGIKGLLTRNISFWLISFPGIQNVVTVAHSTTSFGLYFLFYLSGLYYILKGQPADGAVVDNNVPSPQSHSIPLLHFKSEPSDKTVRKVFFMHMRSLSYNTFSYPSPQQRQNHLAALSRCQPPSCDWDLYKV